MARTGKAVLTAPLDALGALDTADALEAAIGLTASDMTFDIGWICAPAMQSMALHDRKGVAHHANAHAKPTRQQQENSRNQVPDIMPDRGFVGKKRGKKQGAKSSKDFLLDCSRGGVLFFECAG